VGAFLRPFCKRPNSRALSGSGFAVPVERKFFVGRTVESKNDSLSASAAAAFLSDKTPYY
jgi:hypothetical protein